MKRLAITVTLALLALVSCASRRHEYSVAERIEQYGPAVATRLKPAFAAAGVAYPPHELAYLAFKDRAILEVYARNADRRAWKLVRSYPVLAASGRIGPKLGDGDRQVPEGVYHVDWLHANSSNHLSLHLDYPNAFDEIVAQREGREDLGRDIAIHGGSSSIGCLAMGDEVAEDLFVLSAIVTYPLIRVLISPTDFRAGERSAVPQSPPWVRTLYDSLRVELQQFRKP